MTQPIREGLSYLKLAPRIILKFIFSCAAEYSAYFIAEQKVIDLKSQLEQSSSRFTNFLSSYEAATNDADEVLYSVLAEREENIQKDIIALKISAEEVLNIKNFEFLECKEHKREEINEDYYQ